jgi:CheY-like chemotaxis protein
MSKIWNISSELIRTKGLKCSLKIHKDVPSMLMLDPVRFSQIIFNLVTNSIKFTEKGCVQIVIKWIADLEIPNCNTFLPMPYDQQEEAIFEKEYADTNNTNYSVLTLCKKEFIERDIKNMNGHGQKGLLKVIVKDTGCGMTPSQVSKLFQKFSQVSTDASHRQMGTGLGLYITKEIVEKMNGEVRAYSMPNIGSTFIVAIPVFYSPAFGTKVDRTIVIEKLKQKELRCIIADDAGFNLTLMKQYIEKIKGQVLFQASDGREAFKEFTDLQRRRDSGLNLVITDIDMPVEDGRVLCEKIRNLEKETGSSRTFIILISGNDNSNEIKELLDQNGRYQANAFLKKPITFEDLVDCLSDGFP